MVFSRRLKHAQGFRLDLFAKTGVEAGAGHDVGFDPEDGGYLFLDVNEFDQAETRVSVKPIGRSIEFRGRLLATARFDKPSSLPGYYRPNQPPQGGTP